MGKGNQTDAFAIASQLGRFDYASVLLGLVAALLGLAAFPIARYTITRTELLVEQRIEELEGDFERLVSELQQNYSRRNTEQIEAAVTAATNKAMEEELPRALRGLQSLVGRPKDVDPAADQIAGIQEDPMQDELDDIPRAPPPDQPR